MIVAWILIAVGLYFLVAGFASQFQGVATMYEVLAWYFIGIVVFSLGKMSKWKAHGDCPVHGSKM